MGVFFFSQQRGTGGESGGTDVEENQGGDGEGRGRRRREMSPFRREKENETKRSRASASSGGRDCFRGPKPPAACGGRDDPHGGLEKKPCF